MHHIGRSLVFHLLLAMSIMCATGVHASNCFQPTPSENIYETWEPSTLNRVQQKYVINLFKGMRGDWQGISSGFECRGNERSPRKVPLNLLVSADAERVSNGIELRVDLIDNEQKSRRREILGLYLIGNRLSSEARWPKGNLVLVSARTGEIVYKRKWRRAGTDAISGTVLTEAIWSITLQGNKLTIRTDYYHGGLLGASSTWRLERDR